MPTDLIRYDILAQEALRGVVRRVLVDVVRDGLPGDHHFYITFDTRAPGVRLSHRMREKYPDDMTIVLQHQFWDLIVTEHTFEVGLAFGGIPERLLVPFDAVKGFFDPSVQFGLQFEVAGAAEAATDATEPGPQAEAPKAAGRPAEPSRRERPADAPAEPRKDEARKPTAVPSVPPEPAPPGGAEVVSLDKFRKK